MKWSSRLKLWFYEFSDSEDSLLSREERIVNMHKKNRYRMDNKYFSGMKN